MSLAFRPNLHIKSISVQLQPSFRREDSSTSIQSELNVSYTYPDSTRLIKASLNQKLTNTIEFETPLRQVLYLTMTQTNNTCLLGYRKYPYVCIYIQHNAVKFFMSSANWSFRHQKQPKCIPLLPSPSCSHTRGGLFPPFQCGICK